jgi:hypothetical protein
MAQIYMPDDESDPFIYLMDSVSLNGCPLTDAEMTAEQYLQFAARDLEDESERGAVNGISNAKRALHQTVEIILQAYGLLARNRRVSFPQKLELIDEAGLFSLAILNTLNLERNAVEHEYRIPTHARVQEVIDVTRLWLLATRRLSQFVAYESLAGWRADQTLGVVQLDPARGLLSFFKVTGPSQEYEHEGKHYTFLEPIRMTGGALAPGIEIDPSPLWSVALRHQNRDEWSPLLRSVVALNEARYGVDAAVVRRAGIEVSMRVTLPLAEQEHVREFLSQRKKGSAILNYANFVFGFEPNYAPDNSPDQ